MTTQKLPPEIERLATDYCHTYGNAALFKAGALAVLEQADKLASVLNKIGHREEPDDLDGKESLGYLLACEDVIAEAQEALAEWRKFRG